MSLSTKLMTFNVSSLRTQIFIVNDACTAVPLLLFLHKLIKPCASEFNFCTILLYYQHVAKKIYSSLRISRTDTEILYYFRINF